MLCDAGGERENIQRECFLMRIESIWHIKRDYEAEKGTVIEEILWRIQERTRKENMKKTSFPLDL